MGEFFASEPAQSAGPAAEAALELFHDAARSVPAYAAFLEWRRGSAAVRSAEDFDRLPMLTKDNYQRRYQLPTCAGGAAGRLRHGRRVIWILGHADRLAEVGAGRTGGRGQVRADFRHGFLADERSTLAVICFALGSWVGGMYTAACGRHLAAKGYPITVVTPGNDVAEIIRVVEELGPWFDQVVLAGYPPFVKNVIDAGLATAWTGPNTGSS